MNTYSTKNFYNVKELAVMLGVSKSLIYDLIYRKKIPVQRLGRRILIPNRYVKTLMEG